MTVINSKKLSLIYNTFFFLLCVFSFSACLFESEIKRKVPTPKLPSENNLDKKHSPVASNVNVVTYEDTIVTGNLTATDVDLDNLTYHIASPAQKGTVVLLDSSTGYFRYTPMANANGTDNFTFVANDGTIDSNVATTTITINPVNDAPVVQNRSLVLDEDTKVSANFAATDVDNTELTYSIVSGGSKGTVVITNATTGAYTYTPNLNATGSDSFTFRVSDRSLSSNTATVSVTINPVNDPPVANPLALTTNEDTQISSTLTGSDLEGNALSFSIVSNGMKGTATIINAATGAFTYNPNLNQSGSDSFTFKVKDGTTDSNTATVTVTIVAVNDFPVAINGSLSTNEDTATTIMLTGTDADGDALSYRIAIPPSHGLLSGTSPNLTYTPTSNYYGADSFTFRVNDGTTDSGVATISISVASFNDIPQAVAKKIVTNEDTATTIMLTGTDADGDALSYTIITPPSHGALSGTTPNLIYTPTTNYYGADSFLFRVNDGTADSNTATVTVTIHAMIDFPVANNGSLSTNDDPATGIILTGTDADGDALSYRIVTNPSHGVLTGFAPNLTYTPNTNYIGDDSFTFDVNDGTFVSNIATVKILVGYFWVQQFGGNSWEETSAVSVDNSGKIMIAGYTGGSFEGELNKGRIDAFVAKLDASGNFIWKRQLGGSESDFARAVSVGNSENVFIAGETEGSFEGELNLGGHDAFVAKLDASGNFLWKRQLGGGSNDSANAVSVDNSENVFIAGYTYGSFEGESNLGGQDAFVAKLDASGNFLWKRQLGRNYHNGAYGLSVDNLGNVIIVGYTYGSFEGELNLGMSDAFVAKLDASGNLLWKHQLGGSLSDISNGVSVDKLGNVIIVGHTYGSFEGESNLGEQDVFVAKLDASGNLLWKRQLGRTQTDYARGVGVDNSGNVFIAGIGFYDTFIVKLDASGNLLWNRQLGGSGETYAGAVGVDNSGNVIIVGHTLGSFEGELNKGSNDVFVIKLYP